MAYFYIVYGFVVKSRRNASVISKGQLVNIGTPESVTLGTADNTGIFARIEFSTDKLENKMSYFISNLQIRLSFL